MCIRFKNRFYANHIGEMRNFFSLILCFKFFSCTPVTQSLGVIVKVFLTLQQYIFIPIIIALFVICSLYFVHSFNTIAAYDMQEGER